MGLLQLRVGRMTADFEFPRRRNLFNLPPLLILWKCCDMRDQLKKVNRPNYLLQDNKEIVIKINLKI